MSADKTLVTILRGRTSQGEEIFSGVKSITYLGQAISLSSNEEVVAKQKGTSYLLTIVNQTDDYLEVAFIPDPTQQLELTRQCHQWVWECTEYPYNPLKFAL
jgi:hypothetical protein